MASSSIRDAHPELAAAFAVLDSFFSSVQPSNLERTKRVLARCCFLWHAAIPAEIINSGEKSGGRIENSIWIPGPEVSEDDWDYTPPRYISDWLDPIVAAGLLTPNEPPSLNNTTPPAIPGIPGTYYMPPTTQRALTLHLAPPLLTTAFHTVLLHLRSLYPGRLPPPAPGPIDLTTPTPLTTPLRTLLAHHISHLTITYSNHISQLRPQAATALLRPLQSLLNDLTAYYIHTAAFPPARAAGAAALRVSGHPYPPRDELSLSREEFVLNLDTLLLNAWAWAEISPGTETAGYMDGYLVFEGSVEEEGFLKGVRTAAGYWEQGVEMLEEDGVERGEAVGREEVLDAIERGYGEGRRMGGFRVVEEGYNWGNPVGCEGGVRRGVGGKRKGKKKGGVKGKRKGDVGAKRKRDKGDVGKGKRKRDKGDVGKGKRKRDKGDTGEGSGEVELTSPSAEGTRSFVDLTGSSPGATPLDEASDGDSSSGLPAGNGEVEKDSRNDSNSEEVGGDNTNGKEKPTGCPVAEEARATQQQWEPDAELDAEFLLLAGDEGEPSNNVVHHLQSQTSQREDQNSALDEDFELLWGNEDAAMPDIDSQPQIETLPEDVASQESQSDNTDSSSENSDLESDDEASSNKDGLDDYSSDSESGSDSDEESTDDEDYNSDGEMDEDHNSEDEVGDDVGGLEGPVDSHTSLASGASDRERQDAALEEEFLLIEEGKDENTKYNSDSEESEEE